MRTNLYPDDFRRLARACLERADYRCEDCRVRQGTWRISRRSHEFYIVYLHAAHVHHDPHNPDSELRALCPSCHLKYDRRTEGPRIAPRRQGYPVVTVARLLLEARAAGLSITPDGDRFSWQIGSLKGQACDVLDAIGSALHWLLLERNEGVGEDE